MDDADDVGDVVKPGRAGRLAEGSAEGSGSAAIGRTHGSNGAWRYLTPGSS